MPSTHVDLGKVEVVKSTFQWEIRTSCIVDCTEIGDLIKSPLFTTVTDVEFKWRLYLYPKGRKESEKDYISVFLMPCKAISSEILLTAQLTLHAFRNTEQICKSVCSSFNYQLSNGFGKPSFLKRSLLITDETSDILIDDNLTIFCTISFNSTNNILENNDLFICKLKELNHLENLIEDDKFADVTLVVGGTTFKAHKCVLANKSPVFAVMFEHSMKEKMNNEVTIEGTDPKVFKEMLQFIYTGEVNDIRNIAEDLLAEADKYFIERLKIMCEEALVENVSTENAVKYLRLADCYNSPALKKQVIDFIVLNAEEMLNVPEYKSIGELLRGVAFEVIHALTLKNKNF